jgi:Exocyst complex component Sec6
VFALAGVQLRTIRERLTKKSGVLVDAVTIVFMSMQQKQRMSRNGFLRDLETCCAAANDFVRMTDQCDDIVEELLDNTDLPPQDQQTVQEVANELMRQYTNDAMFAAQSIHKYIFEPINEELDTKLFSEAWENDTTNEAALTIVRTIEDFMADIDEWMEEVMVRKLVDGLVRASINFYIKHLLLKAEKTGKKESCFVSTEKAMSRISGDISEIRNFFQGMTESFPALQRVINAEFEIMTNIFAVLYVAANDGDDPQDHFPGIQKAIKNVDICRFMIGDLYHLVAPDKERGIYELFEEHEEQLRAFELNDSYVDEQFVDNSLQLDKIVVKVIGESKRRRPIKGETLKAMEKTIGKWGWMQGGVGGGDVLNSDDDGVAMDENQQM